MQTGNTNHATPAAWAAHVADLLKQRNGDTREAAGWQVMKVAEETGEAVEAWLGYVGQNPRKGVTNGVDKVVAELADVAMTALVAIASLGHDPQQAVDNHMAHMADSGRLAVYEEAAAEVTR